MMAVEIVETGTSSPLPSGERLARQRRVRGPLLGEVRGEGPLTRPKRVDLSPRGRGEESEASSD